MRSIIRDTATRKHCHLQMNHSRAILFAVTEFLATGSQVPLLLVIDAN
jgi:hypothetical protein